MSFHLHYTNHYHSVYFATVLGTACCGIYTILLVYTLWHLVRTRGISGYACTLTTLWILTISSTALDWHRYSSELKYLQGIAVDGGDNKIWTLSRTINNSLSTAVIIMADALMAWRCYLIYGGRKRIIVILGFVVISETVAALVSLTPGRTLESSHGYTVCRYPLGYFLIALFSSSTLITGVGTAIITARISSSTRENPSVICDTTYRRIQRILVQSSIIYSTSMVITAINTLALWAVVRHGIKISSRPHRPQPSEIQFRSNLAKYGISLTYSQALITPLAGIAPTLIALRIITQKEQRETEEIDCVLHLTFRRSHNTASIESDNNTVAKYSMARAILS